MGLVLTAASTNGVVSIDPVLCLSQSKEEKSSPSVRVRMQNVVQYSGGKADREVIREHEFHSAGERGKRRPLKFDVLLVHIFNVAMLMHGAMLAAQCPVHHKTVCLPYAQTSYETVLKDAGVFTRHSWQTMIVDEAHRFKSVSGATRRVVADMDVRWKLLLTGARSSRRLARHDLR